MTVCRTVLAVPKAQSLSRLFFLTFAFRCSTFNRPMNATRQLRPVPAPAAWFAFLMGASAILAAPDSAGQQPVPPIYPVAGFPTERVPGPVATGDINQDGIPDAVVGCSNNPTLDSKITLLIGDGTGGFEPAVSLSTSSLNITDVGLADLNGDGRLDVLATIGGNVFMGTNTLSIWLGTGGGSFGPRAEIALPLSPNSLDIADLNQDGFLDAVVACTSPNAAYILPGNGLGSFAAPIPAFLDAGTFRVRLGDATLDGMPDLMASRTTQFFSILFSYLTVYPATGPTTFGPGLSAQTQQTNPAEFIVSDLDQDGDPDGLCSYTSFLGVHSYPVTAAGFGPSQIIVGSGNFVGLATANLNADGLPDILAVDSSSFAQSLHVLLNAGGSFTTIAKPPVGPAPRRVAIADFNQDGNIDAAVTCGTNSTLAILMGLPNLQFQTLQKIQTPVRTRTLQFADMNLDGAPDAVTCFEGQQLMGGGIIPGGISISSGDGAGGFSAFQQTTLLFGQSAHSIADFNHDGAPDVATINASDGTLRIVPGNGLGGLLAPFGLTIGLQPRAMDAGDLNGDGHMDVVAASHQNNILKFALGTGTGGMTLSPLNPGPANRSFQVRVGDLNRDGFLDVVTANNLTNDVSVFVTNGAAMQFQPAVIYPTASTLPNAAALGDGNYDGFLDLAVGEAGGVSIRTNNGLGVFGPQTLYDSPTPVTAVVYTDLDGDGYHDLGCGMEASNAVLVRRGDGLGGFPTRTDYFTNNGVGTMAASDVDADGRMDLGVDGFNNGGFVLLRNLRPLPSMTVPYGTGTPGCAGTQGLALGTEPRVNTLIVPILATGAPAQTLGITLLADVWNVPGFDYFGIQVLIHLDMVASTSVSFFDMFSDLNGMSFGSFSVPNVPSLTGQVFHIQSVFYSPECMTTPFGLTSSRGLQFTILP